jgi:hypothetical protein
MESEQHRLGREIHMTLGAWDDRDGADRRRWLMHLAIALPDRLKDQLEAEDDCDGGVRQLAEQCLDVALHPGTPHAASVRGRLGQLAALWAPIPAEFLEMYEAWVRPQASSGSDAG